MWTVLQRPGRWLKGLRVIDVCGANLSSLIVGSGPALVLGQALPSWEIFVRLGLAAAMGAMIGLERSLADKPADSRTMILIAVGAAAFAITGQDLMIVNDAGASIRTDPTRVLAYIISGVGFLGAGAILHSKKSIRGLTTAAAIWAVAAVGAACGVGSLDIAGILFAFVVLTMWTPWLYHAVRGDEPPANNTTTNGSDDGL